MSLDRYQTTKGYSNGPICGGKETVKDMRLQRLQPRTLPNTLAGLRLSQTPWQPSRNSLPAGTMHSHSLALATSSLSAAISEIGPTPHRLPWERGRMSLALEARGETSAASSKDFQDAASSPPSGLTSHRCLLIISAALGVLLVTWSRRMAASCGYPASQLE